VSFKEQKKIESKGLVEEYMLMANVLVAKHIHKYCHDKTVLRVHDDIDGEKKEKLADFLSKVDISGVDFSNAKSLSKSMENL
jgi:exoribonuclease R